MGRSDTQIRELSMGSMAIEGNLDAIVDENRCLCSRWMQNTRKLGSITQFRRVGEGRPTEFALFSNKLFIGRLKAGRIRTNSDPSISIGSCKSTRRQLSASWQLAPCGDSEWHKAASGRSTQTN